MQKSRQEKSRQEKRALHTAILVAGLALTLAGCGVGSAPAAEGSAERGGRWPRWTRP